jgi:hypothetical protein
METEPKAPRISRIVISRISRIFVFLDSPHPRDLRKSRVNLPSYRPISSMRGLLPRFISGESIWKHEFAAGRFCFYGLTKE